MREHKFRIWDTKLDKYNTSPHLVLRPLSGKISEGSTYPEGLILMQFTGLLDKNGVDLDWWEGDMFKHPSTDYLMVIVFEDGCFWFRVSENVRYMCYHIINNWTSLPEKIGTIHTHPELLEK